MQPAEPVCLTVKGSGVEANPRSFDAFHKGARIGMTSTPQDDIALLGGLQGQRRSKCALLERWCFTNIRQRNGYGQAPCGDQQTITLQLNGARCRAKGVHEKSEQRSLL